MRSGTFLQEHYLSHKRRDVSEKTYGEYEGIVRDRIGPPKPGAPKVCGSLVDTDKKRGVEA